MSVNERCQLVLGLSNGKGRVIFSLDEGTALGHRGAVGIGTLVLNVVHLKH